MRGIRGAGLALALGACEPQGVDDGTAVGNPGKMTVRLDTEDAPGAERAMMPVEALLGFDCTDDENEEVLATGLVLDVLEGSTLLVPSGEYCGLGFLVEDPLSVEGELDDGRSYTVDLPTGDLIAWNEPGFRVGPGEPLTFWLGAEGAFSEDVLEDEQGDPVVLGAGDPLSEELAEAIAEGTALIGGDDEPRAAVEEDLWDLEPPEDEDDEDDASACQGGAAAGLLLPGLMLLGLRRRGRGGARVEAPAPPAAAAEPQT